MKFWRVPRPPAQVVTDSVVFGSVIQVGAIGEGIAIPLALAPPYRMEAFPSGGRLSVERARAQPSRLLLPRYQVVPFAGREVELTALDEWMTGSGLSVWLVHAAGGQGKTRLAAQLAAGAAASGWAVWRAVHSPAPSVASAEVKGGGAALAVVDYADRWPPSALLALLTDLNALAFRVSMTVRVLLLARSPGFWWSALVDRLDSELDVDARDHQLPALGGQVDRAELFASAVDHFAGAMGAAVPPMAPSSTPERAGDASVLAVHMAALATVDAHHHGTTAPANLQELSAYLLRREYTHWQSLHARTEDWMETSPEVMRRIVYVATLTGHQSR